MYDHVIFRFYIHNQTARNKTKPLKYQTCNRINANLDATDASRLYPHSTKKSSVLLNRVTHAARWPNDRF